MVDSKTGCPSDYADLFENYFPFVMRLVAGAGIREQDVEDVSMDILRRFIEKDGLAKYDPNMVHDMSKHEKVRVEGPQFRTAKFGAMLRGFVVTYVMQYRDKQMSKDNREPVRCETPIGGEQATWLTAFGEKYASADIYDVEFWDWVEQADSYLSGLEMRGKRDLPRVFRMLVEQATFDGKVTRKDIAEAIGVSDTAVCLMVKDLRVALDRMGWREPALVAS